MAARRWRSMSIMCVARPRAPITPPPTFCMRRCGRCWAIMCAEGLARRARPAAVRLSHPKPMTPEELERVEEMANVYRSSEHPSDPPDGARGGERGRRQALFGEKYGDEVRVVSMGTARGKTARLVGRAVRRHACDRTGDIGLFTILGESAVAAGVRRIEALTGERRAQYSPTRCIMPKRRRCAARCREICRRVSRRCSTSARSSSAS